MTDSGKATFIIFPPSTSCELGNWLLKLYEIPHTVVSHTVPFFLLDIRMRGGQSYPFFSGELEGEKEKISGAWRLLQTCDARAPANKKMIPQDEALSKEATDMWENCVAPYFNNPPTQWAYYHLLPHRELVEGAITKDVSWPEKLFIKLCYPLAAWMIRKNLKLDAANIAQTTEEKIRNGFDKLDSVLSDGRPFLCGDRLTFVDIAFAALAAPVILEPRYGNGGLLPDIQDAPAAMQPLVREMRERPAGKHISRLYQDFR